MSLLSTRADLPFPSCEISISDANLYPVSFRRGSPISLSNRADPYSLDGRCGPYNNDLTCDPSSTAYNGTCCSSYGWCGNTPVHCGAGCVSGCGGASSPSPTIRATTAEQTLATLTSEEPVPGPPTPVKAAEAVPVTTDGTCRAGNTGAVCGDWHLGSCCSMYGYCGNT